MLHKVEHLRLEVEDCSEKLKEWERQLESDVMKEVGHGSPQPETGNIPSEESMSALANGAHQQKDMPEGSVEGTQEVEAPPTEEQSHKLSESLKAIWKTIVSKTHPDKTGNDPEMTDLYKRAVKAWNDGDVDIILDIALELRINLSEPDDDVIAALESKANKLAAQLSNMQKSVLWAWGVAPKEKKDAIKDLVVQNRRDRRAAAAKSRV